MRGSRGGTPASQLGGINFELSSVEREASRAGSLRGRRIQRIATQWRRRAGPPLLRRQPLSSAEETRTSRGKGREIRDAEQRRREGSKSGWAEWRRGWKDVGGRYISCCHGAVCCVSRGNTSWMWHTGLSTLHLRQQARLHTNKLVDGWIPGFSLPIMASPFREEGERGGETYTYSVTQSPLLLLLLLLLPGRRRPFPPDDAFSRKTF